MTGPEPVWDIANCRSCDAEIIWATSSGGKAMPVDAAVSEDGNVELSLQPGLFVGPVATVITGPTLFPKPMRKAHFATCSAADKWRRK
ncbi:hypothetical protein Aph02nite_17270 [Actinoplanes philippinensis]|uniref:Uncharacterized protein n=1 Tax=Actinoplanes philippinensis TaxID=35752 RepID=A0A1I2BCF2_9ACTN|nr:hypothetical protein [Actinoplanes philippinensis]GIE75777.1 hypothetical protein Aph02nite_17270 [Actinoplanes philippinensis]SFE52830.1 hypothetical protein SAMN05421541_102191 [Actinoplanes philippinensis]